MGKLTTTKHRRRRAATARIWQALVSLAVMALFFVPTLVVRAGWSSAEKAQTQPVGSWKLVGSDQSDTWKGDKFHGLKSEYTPNYNGNSIGATYTQYNIQFTPQAPLTVSSTFTGTCDWQWQAGSIPLEVVPGTNYPYNLVVDANASGTGFLGGTVNGYTYLGSQQIGFAQVYLNVNGQQLQGHNQVSRVLNMPAGSNEGETRNVTLTCQVDIVTVKAVYQYQWSKAGCTATLTLPEDMVPGKEFTPQAAVLDADQKPVMPKSQAWYYNGTAASLPMKWDGKAATLEYRYVCPNGTQTQKATINIPAAPACRVSLSLPDKMQAGKQFSPQAVVLGLDGSPVTPQDESWSFNDQPTSLPILWDGKAASLTYAFTCPVDGKPVTASLPVPAALGCSATLSLPNKMEPGKEFTPSASVLDQQQNPVVPQDEKWYLNGAVGSLPFLWDGKAATLDYEFTCPLDMQPGKASLKVPPAVGCQAKIILPDDLQQDKPFTPRAQVLDMEDKPVAPSQETWSYNGAVASLPIKWDGKAANLEYAFVCPLDQLPGKASAKIPAAAPSAGWLVQVGLTGAAAAAGLAAAAVGAGMALTNRPKGEKAPPIPKYILQVDRECIKIHPKEAQALTIQCWRILPDGNVQPAPEAAIQVTPLDPAAGLFVSPASGQGLLRCLLSLPAADYCVEVPLEITATAGESGARAQIPVQILPLYELELQWRDPAERILQLNAAEIFAWARLSANPMPDRSTTPDMLAAKIRVSVEGPNKEAVELKTAPPGLQPPFVNQGLLWIPVRKTAEVPAGYNPFLVASYEDADLQLKQSLPLELNQDLTLDMWLRGKKEVDIFYDESSDPPGWVFGDFSLYFHTRQDDSKPVAPSFKTDIDNPKFIFKPEGLLELKDYREEDPPGSGWYTGTLVMSQGADLEQHFGPDLELDQAQVNVTVNVTDQYGEVHPASVTCQIRPVANMVVEPCDEKGKPLETREYAGLELEPNQFLADGKDSLNLRAYFRRTDWPEDTQRYVKYGFLAKLNIMGKDGGNFTVGDKDAAFKPLEGTPGVWISSVKAAKPLLSRTDRKATQLELTGQGGLKKAPSYYQIKKDVAELFARPLYPEVQMWIIPGRKRGTSVAAVLARVPQGGQGSTLLKLRELKDLKCQFKLECQEVEVGFELVTSLAAYSGKKGQAVSEPLPPEYLAWVLDYHGLSWSNVKTAQYTATFSFADGGEAVKVPVSFGQNGAALWAALDAASGSLDMTNPEWQNSSLMWGVDVLIPRECRGFIYNLRQLAYKFFYGEEGMPDYIKHYVCGEYSQRLRRFIVNRRNGKDDPKTALSMNGMECCQYILEVAGFGFHDWCGIHLGGTTPVDDPIFIDPWHIQEWDPGFLQDNFGFKKQTAYLLLEANFLVAEVIVIGGYLLRALANLAPRVLPGLGPKIKDYFGPTIQRPPGLTEILKFLKDKIREMVWPILAVLASGATWWASSATNRDEGCFDDEYNYTNYSEIQLLERLKNGWLNGSASDDTAN